jgi:hypothetical protein
MQKHERFPTLELTKFLLDEGKNQIKYKKTPKIGKLYVISAQTLPL